MKNLTKLFAIAVIILGFSATSFGQIVPPNNGLLTAKASVSSVLAINGAADLNFGSIGSANSGTVIIPTVGTRGGTATLLTGGGEQAGSFIVNAGIGKTISIVMPAGITTITNLSGSTMTISAGAWNYRIGASLVDNIPFSTGAEVTAPVLIGATLNVGANQVTGAYIGTYAITVSME